MAHTLHPFDLTGEELLEAYTHKSLRHEDSHGEKLAFLGERLLNFAIARHWYENLPDISPQELQDTTEQTLSDDLLQACIDKYGLHERLLRADGNDIGPDDCRDFLNVYAGGLYVQRSVSGVQQWVSTLIDPNGSPPFSPLDDTAEPGVPGPSLAAPLPPDPAPPLPSGPGPAETPILPPYSPPPAAPTNINASSNPVTLARFNEYATVRQNHVITWETSRSGEAHRLLWTMTVLLDGQARGTGQAHSQKKAKELAVRDAWTAMGWDASASSMPSVMTSPEPLLLSLSPLSPPIPLQSPPNLTALAVNMTGNAAGTWESVTVAGFNEVAAKQHLQVTWQHNGTGDSHMPTWHSTCLLNGDPRGNGTGRTKKESMLLAVRDAWRNLGWS
ncbi:hypothetical protein AX14_013838 [Amanita brunnescens Koide BX004]|nr:hypothetical protein AX14_013838 [Amanita brunnescens Koide BX004]